MTAHELARKLLEMPDYDVDVRCMDGYDSRNNRGSHGPLEVCITARTKWDPRCVPRVTIGNMLDYKLNVPSSDTVLLREPLPPDEYVARIVERTRKEEEWREQSNKNLSNLTAALKEIYTSAFSTIEEKPSP